MSTVALDQTLVIHREKIIATMRPIVDRLPVILLQDALVQGGLAAKTAERNDLQRLCPDAEHFLQIVASGLRPSTNRDFALHALHWLLVDCLRLDRFPAPAAHALRRGNQAVHRSDKERVRQALEDLECYEALPGLSDPWILLYLLANKEPDRQFIIRLLPLKQLAGKLACDLGAKPPETVEAVPPRLVQLPPISGKRDCLPVGQTSAEPIHTDLDLGRPDPADGSNQSPMPSRLAASLAQPLPFRSPSIHLPPREGSRDGSTFLDKLGALAVPKRGQVNWNLQKLREKMAIPTRKAVNLERIDVLREQTAAFVEQLKSIAVRFEKDNDVHKYATVLNQIASLGTDAHARAEKWSAAFAEIRSEVHAASKSLPKSFQPRISAVVNKVAVNETIYSGAVEFRQIVKEYDAEREKQVEEIFHLATEVEHLAPELPGPERTLHDIVIPLIETLQLEKIKKLAGAAAKEAETRRAVTDCQAKAVQSVLVWVKHHPDIELNEGTQNEVLAAAEAGDADKIHSICAALIERIARDARAKAVEAMKVATRPSGANRPSGATAYGVARAIKTFPLPLLAAPAPHMVPRNRVTAASGFQGEAVQWCNFLMARALEELGRGSVLGVLDHVLDLLAIIATASDGRAEWFRACVALLATMPAAPPFDGIWGKIAATEFVALLKIGVPSLQETSTAILIEPQFDDVISQRFVYKEFRPFVEELGEALYSAAAARSLYLLDDIASAFGQGASIGDAGVALELLSRVAVSAGFLDDLQAFLDALRKPKYGMNTPLKPQLLPEWIWDALGQIASATKGVEPQRSASAFWVIVIPSIRKRGGIPYPPNALSLDLVLYVNFLEESGLGPVEFVIHPSSNPWLANEYVCYLGPLETGEPVIVPICAQLALSLGECNNLQLTYQLVFKERGSGGTKTHDGRHFPAVGKPRMTEVEGYSAASGCPLVLTGECLRLSSSSVRNTLKKMMASLRVGPTAALM